jgi:hypothetical protein
MKDIKQSELKEILHYEPTTGIFKWKVSNNNRINVGDVAGSINSDTGYHRIKINAKSYFAHRLAFLYMTGEFPPEQCDHINHSKDDNRWINLRLVSHQDNQRNRSMRVDNKSGFTGVFLHKATNKWTAQIKIKGKSKHLGLFTELAEAITCRKKANIKYGYHKNHGENNG